MGIGTKKVQKLKTKKFSVTFVRRCKKDALQVLAKQVCKSSLQSSQQKKVAILIYLFATPRNYELGTSNCELATATATPLKVVDDVGQLGAWSWELGAGSWDLGLSKCWAVTKNSLKSAHLTPIQSNPLHFTPLASCFFATSTHNGILRGSWKEYRRSVHIKNLIKVHLVRALWLLPPRPCRQSSTSTSPPTSRTRARMLSRSQQLLSLPPRVIALHHHHFALIWCVDECVCFCVCVRVCLET